MKRISVVGFVILCILSIVMPAYGGENPMTKLERGLGNVVTCHFELFEQSNRVKDSQGSVAGMTYGLLRGAVMTVVRAIVGTYEVVTFAIPAPENYQPILKDPVSFFPKSK